MRQVCYSLILKKRKWRVWMVKWLARNGQSTDLDSGKSDAKAHSWPTQKDLRIALGRGEWPHGVIGPNSSVFCFYNGTSAFPSMAGEWKGRGLSCTEVLTSACCTRAKVAVSSSFAGLGVSVALFPSSPLMSPVLTRLPRLNGIASSNYWAIKTASGEKKEARSREFMQRNDLSRMWTGTELHVPKVIQPSTIIFVKGKVDWSCNLVEKDDPTPRNYCLFQNSETNTKCL